MLAALSVGNRAARGMKRYAVVSLTAWLIGSSATMIGCSSDDKTSNPATAAGTGAGAPAAGTSGSSGSSGSSGAAAASGRSGAAGMTTSGASGKSGSGGAGAPAAGAGGTTAGTGGKSGSGGAAGMSGMQDAGMMSTNDDDAGMVCEPLKSPLNVGGFPKCSPDICPAQDSVCVQNAMLTALAIPESTTALLADCDANSKCVPVALASQAGRAILPKCTSLLGAEGRCTSTCVPQVAQQASQLPRDVCQGADLCAPCYDPRTGEATGACSQGCDTGPTQPPKTFTECCSDRGFCVPPALAGDQARNLERETCSAGNVCAPKQLTDPTFKPKTCNSIDNSEGRCLSTCVAGAVAKQKDRLPTAGCSANEVCAPCFDPVTGEDTGACTVNGDKPAKPAYAFPKCCGRGDAAAGVCVSPALAGDQASILRQESCARDKVCAPTAKAADPAFRFPVCYGTLGTGACVNSCILAPAQAAILTRETCAQGELCAPCELLGSPTGACD
jgi:hypothetical protein